MAHLQRVTFSTPVSIRGVIYPSSAAAARAIGVHAGTISGALSRGTVDNVGTGTNTLRKKPVICDGRKYGSIAEFAAFVGVSAKQMSARLTKASRTGKPLEIAGKKAVILEVCQ